MNKHLFLLTFYLGAFGHASNKHGMENMDGSIIWTDKYLKYNKHFIMVILHNCVLNVIM